GPGSKSRCDSSGTWPLAAFPAAALRSRPACLSSIVAFAIRSRTVYASQRAMPQPSHATHDGGTQMLADDLTATFLTAQAAFTDRVHAVTPAQWQLDTPDAQWTVADLVGHLVDEHRWAAPLLTGLDIDAARAVVAGLGPAGGDGAALVRAWDRAAATSAEAFRADGALTGPVAITRGSVPAAEYLEEMVL